MKEERIQAGTMMVAYVVVYVAAVAVILLDILVWRPW
jgi:hypothetical protein